MTNPPMPPGGGPPPPPPMPPGAGGPPPRKGLSPGCTVALIVVGVIFGLLLLLFGICVAILNSGY